MWIIFNCAVTEVSAGRLKLRALFLRTRGLKRLGRAIEARARLTSNDCFEAPEETLETDFLLQRAVTFQYEPEAGQSSTACSNR
jgi:hypothetical protein